MPFVRVRIVALDGRDRDLRAIEVDLLRLIATYDVESAVGRRDSRIRSAHTHGGDGAPFVLKHRSIKTSVKIDEKPKRFKERKFTFSNEYLSTDVKTS